MKTLPAAAPRQLHIGRLELDLRGIDPALAQAAVRALGPALAGALAATAFPETGVVRLDAGSLPAAAQSTPGALAAAIAGRIARSLAQVSTSRIANVVADGGAQSAAQAGGVSGIDGMNAMGGLVSGTSDLHEIRGGASGSAGESGMRARP